MLMMGVGSVLFAYAGMVALCLGLERHYKQVWGTPSTRVQRLVLRALGWAGLLVSLLLCAAGWGWAMGPVGWFGVISLAGLLLVGVLPYAPRLAVYGVVAVPVWAVFWPFA